MKRAEAKEMFRKDKDAYGKPKAIMHKIDLIFNEFEQTTKKRMDDSALKFEDLSEGMKIEDWWGYPGTIIKCDNIDDVIIDFEDEGKLHYSFSKDCPVDKIPFPIYRP